MKRGLKNTLLGLLGFSAAPMLTACYGMPAEPADQYWDREFQGQVTDTLGTPLSGIQVYVSTGEYWEDIDNPTPDSSIAPTLTDEQGKFKIYIKQAGGHAKFVAKDIDGEENGLYQTSGEQVLGFDGVLEMLPYSPEEDNNEEEENQEPEVNREPR